MDVKRIAGIVMVCAACLFGILISTAFFSTQDPDEVPYWWKGVKVTGTLTEINDKYITIKLQDDKEMSFEMNSLTKISLHGKSSLSKGDLIRISYKPIKSTDVAPIAVLIREIEPSKTETPAPQASESTAVPSPSPSGTPAAQSSPAPSVSPSDNTPVSPDASSSPTPTQDPGQSQNANPKVSPGTADSSSVPGPTKNPTDI